MSKINMKFKRLPKIGSLLIILAVTLVTAVGGLTSVKAAPIIQNGSKFATFDTGGSDVLQAASPGPYEDVSGDVHISGNVGVGTTNPIWRLSVNGPFGFTSEQTVAKMAEGWGLELHGDTTHPIQIPDASLMIGYDQTTWTNRGNNNLFVAGNVGVGTASPGYKLDILGDANASGYVRGQTGLCIGADCKTAWPAGGGGSLPAGTLGQTLRNDGTAVNNGWIANSTLFNDGTNIGVGTVTPAAKLDIRNSGVKSNHDYGLYVLNSSTPVAGSNLLNRYGIYLGTSGSWYGTTSANNYGLYIDPQATGATYNYGLYINTPAGSTKNYGLVVAGGNSGIGTITPASLFSVGPNSEFQVSSTGDLVKINNVSYTWPAANNSGVLTNNGSGTLTWAAASGGGTTISGTPNYISKFDAAGTNLTNSKIFDNGNNVGIGTTTPGELLSIRGFSGKLFVDSSGGMAGVRVKNPTREYYSGLELTISGGWVINDNTAGATRFYLKPDGNIGIGTTVPAYKLDVAGDTNSSGYIRGQTGLCIGADCRTAWPAGGAGGGYTTVQDEGVSLTQRTILNFSGTGVTCTDNTVSGRTDCTVPGGGAGGITGTGAAGQVTFWNGATSVTGSNNFFWDNTNSRLGIGTATPATSLDINGKAKMTGFQLGSVTTAGYVLTTDALGNGTWQAPPAGGGGSLPNGTVAGQTPYWNGASWQVNGNLTNLGPSGNIGIGTVSPGAKVQINAPSSTEALRLITDSLTSPLNIRNSGNTADIFRVDQSGILQVGSVPWARLTSFPSACSAGQFVTAVGSTLACATPPAGGGGLGGSGTLNYVAKFTPNGTTLGNSQIFDNGTNIGIGTAAPTMKLDVNGSIQSNRNSYVQSPISNYPPYTSAVVGFGELRQALSDYPSPTTAIFGIGWDSAVSGAVGVLMPADNVFGVYGYGGSGTSGIRVTGASYLNRHIELGPENLAVNYTPYVDFHFTGAGVTAVQDYNARIINDSNNSLILNTAYSAALGKNAIRILNDKIGIQNINPNYTLDVAGDINSSGYVRGQTGLCIGADCRTAWPAGGGGGISGSGAAGQVTFWNGTTSVTGNSNLYWDNTNTRLGIGIATPSYKLDTSTSLQNDGMIVRGPSSSYIGYSANFSAGGSGLNALVQNLDAGMLYSAASGGFVLGPANNTTNGIRISSNGNIGVGVAAPGAKVQINAPASTEALRLVTNSLTSPLNIRNSGNTADIFRVDQSGILQVGNVPWARLSSIPAACGAGSYVTNIATGACGIPAAGGLGGSGTVNYLPKFTTGTSVGNSQLFDNGTNMGIGTAAPSNKLDVTATAQNDGLVVHGLGGVGVGYGANFSAGAGTFYNSLTQLNDGGILYGTTSGGFVIGQTGTSLTPSSNGIRITGAGNVGIGKSSPTQKLDVNGNINGTQLCISGVCQASWPPAGAVSSVNAGTGISVSPITGNVVVSLNLASANTWSGTQTFNTAAVMNTGLRVAGNTTVDSGLANIGTASNFLQFGGTGSGEGIGSKRNIGGNQYGLDFYTSSTNRMSITSIGRIGIGTAAPSNKLDVIAAQNDGAVIHGPNGTGIGITPNTSASYNNNLVQLNDSAVLYGSLSGGLVIGQAAVPGNSNGIRMDSAGNVGIGIANPGGYKLYVNGNTWVQGTVGYSSDARLKTNIQPIGNALGKVLKLEGVNFEFDLQKNPNLPSGTQIGFIAQKVEPIVPEVVMTDAQGYKGISYANLTALLVEAIKDLNNKISTIFAKLNQHDNQLTKQQQMLDAQARQIQQLQKEIELLKSK